MEKHQRDGSGGTKIVKRYMCIKKHGKEVEEKE